MFIDPLPEPGTPSVCMDVDSPPNVAVPASAAMDSESEFVVTSITDCRFRGLAHFREQAKVLQDWEQGFRTA